jgi:TRAP-type mannitol/chloroaromatic compound transport system permease large subunit
MGWIGLALLLGALALLIVSGWPTYVVVITVSVVGAALGVALGAFDAAVLGALPARLVGLLEHDLLQAIALYALVGSLLTRLGVADAVYRGLARAGSRLDARAAPAWSGLALAALFAPMNGSVGASLVALQRSAGAFWAEGGMPPARRCTLTAVAGTLGVIVPPSLVLLLLSEAMMAAHTEGLNLARSLGTAVASTSVRVINTQDVVTAATLPGLLLLLLWAAVAWFTSRRAGGEASTADLAGETPPAPPTSAGAGLAWLAAPLAILVLLVLVALGVVRAVEGAATFGTLLLVWAIAGRRLSRSLLGEVLDDAMALTGSLFALLIAATSLSLVLRAFGTDRLVAGWMLALQGREALALLVVFVLLLAFAFVLDAFEIIFLVVPLLMPPVLAQVADAAWVVALTLLVLQLGFLMPPFGYAIVLARSQVTAPLPAWRPLLGALVPYLVALLLVIAAVATNPRLAHPSGPSQGTPPPTTSGSDDLDQRLRDMAAPRDSGR